MGYQIGLPSLKLNNVGRRTPKCGDFGGVAREALEERQGRDPDIDGGRTHLNVYNGFRSAEELMRYSDEHCEQLRDKSGRKIRSDAVRMCATIIKPPAAYMNTLSEKDRNRLLMDARSLLADIVGEDNIKADVIHKDEQGDHMHVFWEPMTADGRLCAKEVHNLQFFGRLNREMPEHLRNCGWDIDDCNAYDCAKEEYEKEQQKTKDYLEQRRKSGRTSMRFKADAERERRKALEELDKANEMLENLKPALDLKAVADMKIKKTITGKPDLSWDDVALMKNAMETGAFALKTNMENAKDFQAMEADLEAEVCKNEKLEAELAELRPMKAFLQQFNLLQKFRDWLPGYVRKTSKSLSDKFKGTVAEKSGKQAEQSNPER